MLQVYVQPVFEVLETKMADVRQGRFSLRNVLPRLVFRSLYIAIATFFAAMLPFFGDIISLIGAFGYTPLDFVLPMLFYQIVFKPSRRTAIFWLNWSIIIVFSIVGVMGCIASVRSIINNATTYHLFADIWVTTLRPKRMFPNYKKKTAFSIRLSFNSRHDHKCQQKSTRKTTTPTTTGTVEDDASCESRLWQVFKCSDRNFSSKRWLKVFEATFIGAFVSCTYMWPWKTRDDLFIYRFFQCLALCRKPNLRIDVARVARFLKRQLQQLLRWMILRGSSEYEKSVQMCFEHINYRTFCWRCSKANTWCFGAFRERNIYIWPWKPWEIFHEEILPALELCGVRGGFLGLSRKAASNSTLLFLSSRHA